MVTRADRPPVAENRPVLWQQGPADAFVPLTERPPNIVFILLDDLGINDLTVLGDGIIPTPNIDALAARGAVFTNAYSGTGTCAPSAPCC